MGLDLGALCFTRINAGRKQGSSVIPTLTRFFQRYLRVGAEGELLLLTGKTVFQFPQFAPRGGQEQVKPLLVSQLLCRALGFADRIAVSDRGIGGLARRLNRQAPKGAPESPRIWTNDSERPRSARGRFSHFSGVLSTVNALWRTGEWCPEEDSNLHDLAIAST